MVDVADCHVVGPSWGVELILVGGKLNQIPGLQMVIVDVLIGEHKPLAQTKPAFKIPILVNHNWLAKESANGVGLRMGVAVNVTNMGQMNGLTGVLVLRVGQTGQHSIVMAEIKVMDGFFGHANFLGRVV